MHVSTVEIPTVCMKSLNGIVATVGEELVAKTMAVSKTIVESVTVCHSVSTDRIVVNVKINRRAHMMSGNGDTTVASARVADHATIRITRLSVAFVAVPKYVTTKDFVRHAKYVHQSYAPSVTKYMRRRTYKSTWSWCIQQNPMGYERKRNMTLPCTSAR